jgi:hypothetical protein
VLVAGDDEQVGLRFRAAKFEQVGPRRLHLHLTSTSAEEQERTVETVLRLGGRHLDVGQADEDRFVVMADPDGDELCVIEPGNSFLAGTGFLGEVTCEGTRDVGLFWRDALGWPLVWDQNGETAIQAPRGGTKLSWGGPPVEPQHGPNRQRFDLVTSDVAAAKERLVSLGATPVESQLDGVQLADPDGNELGLNSLRG